MYFLETEPCIPPLFCFVTYFSPLIRNKNNKNTKTLLDLGSELGNDLTCLPFLNNSFSRNRDYQKDPNALLRFE